MARVSTPSSHDTRVVLVGIYFIAVGGAFASQTVARVLRDLRDRGRSDEILLALAAIAVGAWLWWIAGRLLTGKPTAFWFGVAGSIATMAVTFGVVVPRILLDGLAGVAFGGFLLALPVLSLLALYAARRELGR